MKREELIKKWLDNELSVQERDAFEKLEDYDTLVKLSNSMHYFKASHFDTDKEYEALKENLKYSKQRSINWITPLLKIASILVVLFGIYYYTTTLNTELKTIAGQKSEIVLPDSSEVVLNALSSVTYNKKDWKHHRDIHLDGEAYFKVAKGATFNVHTDNGIITVLGTEFTVKNRKEVFEVICYEGSVRVKHKQDTIVLTPGDHYTLSKDISLNTSKKISQKSPSWLLHESSFESIPLYIVIADFERQYGMVVSAETIDTNQLFTGSFTHKNINIALKAITIPLNITYAKTNEVITFK